MEDKKTRKRVINEVENDEPINCLKNEKVTVRFIKKRRGIVENQNSPLYGGMAETSIKCFTVPKDYRSNNFKEVLTQEEALCLEEVMGLEHGVFNPYKIHNNYWSTSNSNSINNVRLTKRDTILDLSVPQDYIKYKILLTNKDLICPSLQTLEEAPKPTYIYVLINDNAEAASAGAKIDIKMECYSKLIEYKNNISILRSVIELFENKKLAANTRIEFLRTKAHDYVESNSKLMYKILNDPYLEIKATIKEAVNAGIIANRNNFYYMRDNGNPLSEENQDPTLNNAAIYLSNLANQDLLYSIQAQIKK